MSSTRPLVHAFDPTPVESSSSPYATQFIDPPWDEPIDLDEVLRHIPADTTVKGIYLASSVRVARSHGAVLPDLRFLSFGDYPGLTFVQVLTQCAQAAFPHESLRQGLRRLGWDAFPTFASSAVGKIILSMMGRDPHRAFANAGRAYRLAATCGRVEYERLGARAGELRLTDIYSFPDCYHVGVAEGVLRALEYNPKVRINRASPTTLHIELCW